MLVNAAITFQIELIRIFSGKHAETEGKSTITAAAAGELVSINTFGSLLCTASPAIQIYPRRPR